MRGRRSWRGFCGGRCRGLFFFLEKKGRGVVSCYCCLCSVYGWIFFKWSNDHIIEEKKKRKKRRKKAQNSPLFFVNPNAACFDVVYARIPALATNEDAEARFTIAPRVVPRLGFRGEIESASWARMAMDASFVTRNMLVVLTSRKRWNSAKERIAMSAAFWAPICFFVWRK